MCQGGDAHCADHVQWGQRPRSRSPHRRACGRASGTNSCRKVARRVSRKFPLDDSCKLCEKSSCITAARSGQLVHLEAPEGDGGEVFRTLGFTPGGGVVRVFTVHVKPGSILASTVLAARTCLFEAMLTPQVPRIIGGDSTYILEGSRLEAASLRHGWTSHRWRGLPYRRQGEERRIGWLLFKEPASVVVEGLAARRGSHAPTARTHPPRKGAPRLALQPFLPSCCHPVAMGVSTVSPWSGHGMAIRSRCKSRGNGVSLLGPTLAKEWWWDGDRMVMGC